MTYAESVAFEHVRWLRDLGYGPLGIRNEGIRVLRLAGILRRDWPVLPVQMFARAWCVSCS